MFGIFEKNFHWVSVVRGLYLGKLFTEITQPPENTAFFSSCNNSHVGLLVRELKKVNKQHLKFINRCNHLPQTHKKLLLKLFIDTKSYRQIYCLVHSSGCNKNVLKGVQIGTLPRTHSSYHEKKRICNG